MSAHQMSLPAHEIDEAFRLAREIYFADRTVDALVHVWRNLGCRKILLDLVRDPDNDVKRTDARLALDYALTLLDGATPGQTNMTRQEVMGQLWCPQSR